MKWGLVMLLSRVLERFQQQDICCTIGKICQCLFLWPDNPLRARFFFIYISSYDWSFRTCVINWKNCCPRHLFPCWFTFSSSWSLVLQLLTESALVLLLIEEHGLQKKLDQDILWQMVIVVYACSIVRLKVLSVAPVYLGTRLSFSSCFSFHFASQGLHCG